MEYFQLTTSIQNLTVSTIFAVYFRFLAGGHWKEICKIYDVENLDGKVTLAIYN